jgi:hypothetical protein
MPSRKLKSDLSQQEIFKRVQDFLMHYLEYSKEELLQERVKYRDHQSIEVMILNQLIKSKVLNRSKDYFIQMSKNYLKSNTNEAKVIRALAEYFPASASFTQAVMPRSRNSHHQINAKDENTQKFLNQFGFDEYVKLLSTSLPNTQSENVRINYHKAKLKRIKDAELYLNMAEVTDQQSEILKSIADAADKSDRFHQVAHLTDSSIEGLKNVGIIGMMASNVLGLFINTYRCLRERRMPSDFEKAKIAYSSVILTLGILIFIGVGGPIAASIFGASALFLAFTKNLAEIVRDAYRLGTAKKAVEQYISEEAIIQARMKQQLIRCVEIKTKLLDPLNKENQESLKQEFKTAFHFLQQQKEKLLVNEKRIFANIVKFEILNQRQQSKLEKVRKIGSFLGAGICAVGAAMSLTSLAPLGFALIGFGALISVISETGFRLAKFFKNRSEAKFKEIEESTQMDQNELTAILDKFFITKDSEALLKDNLGSNESESPADEVLDTSTSSRKNESLAKACSQKAENDDTESESSSPHL